MVFEADYNWSEDGRLLGVTVSRVEADPNVQQGGCERPSPGVIVCQAELTYNEELELVSYVEAGTEYVVSDNCCGYCTQPDT
jgi:hypothetical protein